MTENWKIGKIKSTVVSDRKVQNTNFPSPPNPTESRDEELEYYDGFLVCESIGNSKHAKLIAATPELCDAVKYLIDIWDEVQGNWREKPDHVQQKFLSAYKKASE